MADIPVDPWLWSSTAATNSPSGSTAVGTNLDDNLRALQAAVKMSLEPLSAVAGTNTITGTATGLTAYASGQRFLFVPANTNTAATTLNVTSLGAKNVFSGGAACVGGELVANVPALVSYDGTQFNIVAGMTSAGSVDLSTGNLVGIKFDATQNASADANTLDDYEEGTWTPTLSFATPGNLSVAYTSQIGTYTKIGRLVRVSCTIVTSNFTHSTASGNCRVTGLPFAAGATYEHSGACQWQGVTKAGYTQVTPDINPSVSYVEFSASGSGLGRSSISTSDMPSGGTVHLLFSATYHV